MIIANAEGMPVSEIGQHHRASLLAATACSALFLAGCLSSHAFAAAGAITTGNQRCNSTKAVSVTGNGVPVSVTTIADIRNPGNIPCPNAANKIDTGIRTSTQGPGQ